MTKKRLLIGIIVVTMLFLLMLYSGLTHNEYDPDIHYILENFDMYNNTRISFCGKIIGINKSNNELIIKPTEPPTTFIRVNINTTPDTITKGDIAEILGILDGNDHVTAEKILISKRWKNDLIYLRSLPAVPFALYLFFKTYTFNRKTIRFERRKPHG